MRERQFVILGGGEIRDYRAVAARIGPEDFILCADSGLDHCQALGVAPHLLVGDLDSVRSPIPADLPRVLLPAEKNHTDTTHAIEEALERGARRILLAGALGGRLDHTLANLQSLAFLSRRGVEARLTDGRTEAAALTGPGEMTLSPQADRYFSLLALTEACEGVSIRGAKYLLDRYTLRFDRPRAVSNEFLDGPATLSLETGTMAVLIVPKDA